MKKHLFIIIGVAFMFISGGNGKGGKTDAPYDGGPGIGIDTETVNRIQQYEDSERKTEPENEAKESASSSSAQSSRSYSSSREDDDDYDNMRGFDPASEDDMDDNGMSRYMENNDDEGWD